MHLNSIDPYASIACPSRPLIDLIGAKWTILVFGRLQEGKQRFSELSARVSGITPKELTKTLRQMERAGLVNRTVYPVVPPRVEYELTNLGHSLREPVEMLLKWMDEHIGEYLSAQHRFDTGEPA